VYFLYIKSQAAIANANIKFTQLSNLSGKPNLWNKSQIPSRLLGKVNKMIVITLLLFSQSTAKTGMKQKARTEKTVFSAIKKNFIF